MDGCLDVWMYIWLDGLVCLSVYGWMGECMHGWVDVWANWWVGGWVNERIYGRLNVRLGGHVDGVWMDW
jgi:hypothetical protein